MAVPSPAPDRTADRMQGRPRGSSSSQLVPPYENPEAKLRYQVYSRLQSTSVAIGESFPIPEIVAVGGQSDGKSSLLEAFLGFRFNVREVEMGTRRPLIVQMYHDPTAHEPRCRLQDEDGEEYGPAIIPETAVADAIMQRTQDHLQKLGGATVSSKPVVMKVEYAYCPNLTIIDTPGFILKAKNGEADRTPEDILSMVKAQAQPAHRLILFLQQSSVEWASSLWLNVVQEVDPTFQRTVFVASKFDNRLKEFAERWEVDKYLAATGYLPPKVRPFFVALPKDRSIQSSAEWRRQMSEVDASIFHHLKDNVKGGYDEERFGSRIGFNNLKRFLEEELARRYREAAPNTLAVLQDRVESASKELIKAEGELRAAVDVAAMRAAAMRFAHGVASTVDVLLAGSTDPDPAVHGLTTEEERVASRLPLWPGTPGPVVPPNAGLKLFGGAAFERCLHEFQEAAHALQFPATVATDRVANLLLAYKGRSSFMASNRAAEDIARHMAREVLGPLLDTASARLTFVLRRVFEIAADQSAAQGNSRQTLRPYVAFHASLRSAHQSFLTKLEESTRAMLRQTLESATSEFAVNMLASIPDVYPEEQSEYSHGEEEEGEANGGVSGAGGEGGQPTSHGSHMAARLPHSSASALGLGPGRHIDNSPSKRAPKASRYLAEARNNTAIQNGESYEEVIRRAEKLFKRIRFSVAQQSAPTTLKSAFLDPLKTRLGLEVALEIFARTDADFMAMFTAAAALAALQTKRDNMHKRAESLVRLKNEFQELSRVL
mmetsp:Transcript_4509/g.12314  ORF Transcript_4509/g.12314 Transcript_4509/m.12314 type:complete len:775 (-) Transcript_4509:922-3246(-)